MNSKDELKIDWCTHEAAVYACTHWHYSKSFPVGPIVKIGAWENGKFIGCVLFSRGANRNLLLPYGLKQTEGCELTRVALTSHSSQVTRIIRIAIAFLKKSNKGLRVIVSYADPSQGHYGGIYQGGNWVYSGLSSPIQAFVNNDTLLHRRQVSVKGYNFQMKGIRKTYREDDCIKVILPRKHRYLMPLDDDMRERIKPLAKPYPKPINAIKAGDGCVPQHSGSATLT
jgi:hypothetical protein